MSPGWTKTNVGAEIRDKGSSASCCREKGGPRTAGSTHAWLLRSEQLTERGVTPAQQRSCALRAQGREARGEARQAVKCTRFVGPAKSLRRPLRVAQLSRVTGG